MKIRRAGTTLKTADPVDPDFRIAHSPFYWLVRVAHQYSHNMDQVLKRIGMDLPRWRVLMILTEFEPCSVSYLADHAATKLSTMTKTVQRLEADRLVATSAGKADARVTEVRLEKTGREAVGRVRVQASRIYGKTFEGMNNSAILTLNRTLEKMFNNLNDSPD